jgi:hypothetical protein
MRKNMSLKVCWDIDDTIWKIQKIDNPAGRYRAMTANNEYIEQVPDYDLIGVVRWFYQNGDKVYFWSAGGIDYAQMVVNKLGLAHMGKVVEKGSFKPDIAFDDCETNLGKVDVRVNRESSFN